MAAKKKVLSVAQTEPLRRRRRRVLEKAGYLVSSPADLNGIEELSKTGTFDVAVIGYAFEPNTKSLIAEVIRKYCPTAPIVELTKGHAHVPDAVACKPDPRNLLATIDGILKQKIKNTA